MGNEEVQNRTCISQFAVGWSVSWSDTESRGNFPAQPFLSFLEGSESESEVRLWLKSFPGPLENLRALAVRDCTPMIPSRTAFNQGKRTTSQRTSRNRTHGECLYPDLYVHVWMVCTRIGLLDRHAAALYLPGIFLTSQPILTYFFVSYYKYTWPVLSSNDLFRYDLAVNYTLFIYSV